jgi:hypothetical protein
MDNVLSIKASIAALVLGVAMLSMSQAGSNAVFEVVANSDRGLPPVTTKLTTKTNILSADLEPAPGWLPVADRDRKSGCMKNLSSQKVLCSATNLRKLAEIAKPLYKSTK